MASTNKTTHYELSQYVGSDKPTYLTDYNNDMSAIDTGIYNAQTKADSAYTAAGLADGKAGDAQTTANSAVTSAGTANTNIGTMANLNTTEKSSLVGAINEVNNRLNFVTFKRFTSDDFSYSQNNISLGGNNLNIAKTNDGSYCKLYGILFYNGTSSTTPADDTIITVSNTGLTPDSEFTVNCLGLSSKTDSAVREVNRVDVTFKTNGTIQFNLGKPISTQNNAIFLFPSVIQVKSFGDQPE